MKIIFSTILFSILSTVCLKAQNTSLTINLSEARILASNASELHEITVTSGISWQIIGSTPNWINVNSISGIGRTLLKFYFDENLLFGRDTTLFFANELDTVSLYMGQLGIFEPEISSNMLVFSGNELHKSVTYFTSSDNIWSIYNSLPSWLSTDTTIGIGISPMTFKVTPNNSDHARKHVVEIAGSIGSKFLTIIQEPLKINHRMASTPVKTITGCNGTLSLGDNIHSYGNTISGIATILPSNPSQLIKLSFAFFDCEYSDPLKIYMNGDTNSTPHKFWGTQNLGIILSTIPGSPMTLSFRSNLNDYGNLGFLANISCVNTFSGANATFPGSAIKTLTGCDFLITDDGGISNNYSINSSFQTTIKPSINNLKATVSFYSFESDRDNDALTIYNGHTTNEANYISSYSGNDAPINDIVSTDSSGTLTLKFKSISSVPKAGFIIKTGCVEKSKLSQSITGFNVLPTVTFTGNNVITLSGVVASSQLPVNFSITGPAKLVMGNVISILGIGTVSVTASQEGDSNYNPAQNITLSFEVISISGTVLGFNTISNYPPLIKLHPNPADDKINIDLAEDVIFYSISDPMGNVILEASSKVVNTSGFQNGLYFIFVQTRTHKFNHKIIINH